MTYWSRLLALTTMFASRLRDPSAQIPIPAGRRPIRGIPSPRRRRAVTRAGPWPLTAGPAHVRPGGRGAGHRGVVPLPEPRRNIRLYGSLTNLAHYRTVWCRRARARYELRRDPDAAADLPGARDAFHQRTERSGRVRGS